MNSARNRRGWFALGCFWLVWLNALSATENALRLPAQIALGIVWAAFAVYSWARIIHIKEAE